MKKLQLGTDCECGEELDFESYKQVIDFFGDETNKGCCRGQAQAILEGLIHT